MINLGEKGQTLVEALIALGVATIIITAIGMVVITSLDNATFSKNQNLATQYAQEGMDIMRKKSNTDWGTFIAFCPGGNCTFCLPQSSENLVSGTCTTPNITNGIGNKFIRKIIMNSGAGCSATGQKVSVIVSWGDGKCKDAGDPYCHNVTLDTCFEQINSG